METQAKVYINQNTITFNSSYLALNLKDSQEYTINIHPIGRKKTLRQNRFFWKILSECVKSPNSSFTDKLDLYVYLFEKAGVQSEVIWFDVNAIPKDDYRYIKYLEYVDVEKDGQIKHLVICECFKGISNMNSKDMALMIEYALDYAADMNLNFMDEWLQIRP